ncbi:MAG: pyruvate:ferredoxin (flavodoxin) oxidoreductase [Chloroflexota bacterium]
MDTKRDIATIEGNEAAAYVAYKTNEVVAIYPITPSSPMSELADQWSASEIKNIWGSVPLVQEMQSEGGAAGALHGALQTGSLCTTFTSSQGLLLMIPNMYKIAGELTSTVFHIAARTIATSSLSIFGDHSDVMATRATGWAMLFANSPQEVMDFALMAQASTLKTRVPFLHIFDGFRTSHEINKIEMLSDADIRALIDDDLVRAHRIRGLSPDHPVVRGTAQNPDTFFQTREATNRYYDAVPAAVQAVMDQFAAQVGRRYGLFEYVGAADAERVVIAMGSGCDTLSETVKALNAGGEKVGVLKVRLYRPFSAAHFVAALPPSVRAIAVLDRTKEPGALGEPLYQDVATAINEVRFDPQSESLSANLQNLKVMIGGRYGLSSKEFTPAMAKAVFDELAKARPKNHFTVGIHDDVTHTSLSYDPEYDIEPADTVRALFWGLGSDGTVGANKNSIKIIGEETDNYAQGYFVYDSKKAGARTISHLRFGPHPINSPYLICHANFVACHQFNFLERYPVLENVAHGATFLINSPYGPDEVWEQLPNVVQREILAKQLKLYVIDGDKVASEAGMGNRVNTVMQVCFFAISGIMPRDEAIDKIKQAIRKTYSKRGEIVIRQNFAAVDSALAHLYLVPLPLSTTNGHDGVIAVVPHEAPEFVQQVTARMMAGEGDLLPVSAIPVDRTYPSATSQWERRNLADEVPVWDSSICIQCGKCVFVCPHSVIRAKVIAPEQLGNAPDTFKTADARWKEFPNQKYSLQVSVEDCTGCTLCVEVCPVKNKSNVSRKAINMAPQLPLREPEKKNWAFFQSLPDISVASETLHFNNVKNVQLLRPLFEFSGACLGCGETPYLKLLSQVFGDRAIIANATGCSSIYGGNLPTTPWAKDIHGRGPAWSNSLFEDNAEFGLGMRLAVDKQTDYARDLVMRLRDVIGEGLVDAVLNADQSSESLIAQQRQRVADLKVALARATVSDAQASLVKDMMALADTLVKKSVWIVGGDGWAYDIGFGGLDHVLSSGRKLNILVLDTEVYSNTGGQSSKATPMGAIAKFAAGGKHTAKKDLGAMAMQYGNVYVAQVAMGANDAQTVKAFLEAEAYPGVSIIIAYSHCIAHGIDMSKGLTQQKLAVESAYWPLFRYNPLLRAQGKNPFQLDSAAPKIAFKDYAYNETRYRVLSQTNPQAAADFMKQAQAQVSAHWAKYEQLAKAENSAG